MLPRSHRLPSPEISLLMRSGKRISRNGITLLYRIDSRNLGLHTAEDSGNRKGPRFAFIVSTKVDKRAVVRNRIRRLMSESVRHQLDNIASDTDGVFIGSKSLIGLTQEQVNIRIQDLLYQAGLESKKVFQ